jgi:hypothetical protein
VAFYRRFSQHPPVIAAFLAAKKQPDVRITSS